jgi:N-hydroxyarylamine O-acetyltransferase
MRAEQLDAYLARIGVQMPVAPDLPTLRRLVFGHTHRIPFENVDVLLGLGISLDPEAVFDKLVRRGRGGYCFEQNTLMMAVLEAIGFNVTPLAARARVQRPREMTPPRTHLFLRVELEDGPWLVDVGVGGLSPTAPIRLVDGAETPTPHELRRVIVEDGRWFHQAKLGPVWADVAEFLGEPMPAIDREIGNWYTSTHPESRFRLGLMVAVPGLDGTRRTLLNRELTHRDRDGNGVVRVIASPEALRGALAEVFGLTIPEGAEIAWPGLSWAPAGGAPNA